MLPIYFNSWGWRFVLHPHPTLELQLFVTIANFNIFWALKVVAGISWFSIKSKYSSSIKATFDLQTNLQIGIELFSGVCTPTGFDIWFSTLGKCIKTSPLDKIIMEMWVLCRIYVNRPLCVTLKRRDRVHEGETDKNLK